MTLANLLQLAYYGAGLDDNATAADCQEIRAFADLWYENRNDAIEDLHLSRLDLDGMEKDFLSIGGCKL